MGAWIEIGNRFRVDFPTGCRPRMGAWIEMSNIRKYHSEDKSPPYGGVD